MIILGIAKILAGSMLGESLLAIFDQFPLSILAVMLFVAGLSMLDLIRNINEDSKDIKGISEPLSNVEKIRRWQVLMITVGTIVAFHNDGIGVVAGLTAHLMHKLQDTWSRGQEHRDPEAAESLLPA